MIVKTLVLLVLLQTLYAQTCFGVQSSDVAVCSSQGACISQDVCSCYSGFDGSECANKASTETCTWNNNTQSSVDFYPVMDLTKVGFVANQFQFSIQAPLVNKRLNSTVYIQSKQYADCMYPGQYALNVLDESTPCYNRINYSVPWDLAVNCGWSVSETSDDTTKSGNIYVDAIETIGEIRGYPIQRNIQTVIPIAITFKKRLAMSTLITMDSNAGLYAAILSKVFLPGPPVNGVFQILTSLQYPYALNTSEPFSVTANPTGMTATVSDISSAPECPVGLPCLQRFNLQLVVDSACTFTGTYQITFKLGCHPSVAAGDCPVKAGADTEVVTLTVNSEDFCTKVNINIDLLGAMLSFSDSALLTPKNSFTSGDVAYFQAQMVSSKVFLTGCKVVQVLWEQGVTTKVLYSEFQTTADGITQGLQILANTTTTASFSFNVDSAWMAIPEDGREVFNVSMIVEVSYASAGSQGDYTKLMQITFDQNDLKRDAGRQSKKQTKSIFAEKKKETSGSVSNFVGLCVMIAMLITFA